jgi:formylglycine-generating enzyme required for sulfatase activity
MEGESLDDDDQPVVFVSWHDARGYADWLSRNSTDRKGSVFRLPTEAEWEFAARAGTDTVRYWGIEEENTEEICGYANVADKFYQMKRVNFHNCSDSFIVSAPVGSFPANPAGLHDMLGNVWEWCADRYGKETYRINQEADSPRNPLYQIRENGMDYRVIRGGSWLSEPNSIRCAKRSPMPPASKFNVLGFRVVMEAVLEKEPAPQ